MRLTLEELRGRVESLPYQDKERILLNVLWCVFGDSDEEGDYLSPHRRMDRVDGADIADVLRDEFFPSETPCP